MCTISEYLNYTTVFEIRHTKINDLFSLLKKLEV